VVKRVARKVDSTTVVSEGRKADITAAQSKYASTAVASVPFAQLLTKPSMIVVKAMVAKREARKEASTTVDTTVVITMVTFTVHLVRVVQVQAVLPVVTLMITFMAIMDTVVDSAPVESFPVVSFPAVVSSSVELDITVDTTEPPDLLVPVLLSFPPAVSAGISVTKFVPKIASDSVAKRVARKEVSITEDTTEVSITVEKVERKVDITAAVVSSIAKLFANLGAIHHHSVSDRTVVLVIQVLIASERIAVLAIQVLIVSESQAFVVRNHHHHPNAILLRTVTAIIAATPRHHRKSRCHQRSTVIK